MRRSRLQVRGTTLVQLRFVELSVADLSEDTNEFMRDAAYMIAIQRVATACRLRGWA